MVKRFCITNPFLEYFWFDHAGLSSRN